MKKLVRHISKIVVWLITCLLAGGLFAPAHAVAQTKKTTAPPKKPLWYLDYSVTVKGNGTQEGDASGSPRMVWSIDRNYSGNVALTETDSYIRPKEWKALVERLNAVGGNAANKAAEAQKVMNDPQRTRWIRATHKQPEKNLIHIEINDKIEVISEDPCSDNSLETTTEVKIWKITGEFPSQFAQSFITDNTLPTYNVIISVLSRSDITMFSQTKYSRTRNVQTSKKDTSVMETKTYIPPLPAVQGLISSNDASIQHADDQPLPADFSTVLKYDSGDLTPDKPLIEGIPESKTDVKIRVIYHISKTPLY